MKRYSQGAIGDPGFFLSTSSAKLASAMGFSGKPFHSAAIGASATKSAAMPSIPGASTSEAMERSSARRFASMRILSRLSGSLLYRDLNSARLAR